MDLAGFLRSIAPAKARTATSLLHACDTGVAVGGGKKYHQGMQSIKTEHTVLSSPAREGRVTPYRRARAAPIKPVPA